MHARNVKFKYENMCNLMWTCATFKMFQAISEIELNIVPDMQKINL